MKTNMIIRLLLAISFAVVCKTKTQAQAEIVLSSNVVFEGDGVLLQIIADNVGTASTDFGLVGFPIFLNAATACVGDSMTDQPFELLANGYIVTETNGNAFASSKSSPNQFNVTMNTDSLGTLAAGASKILAEFELALVTAGCTCADDLQILATPPGPVIVFDGGFNPVLSPGTGITASAPQSVSNSILAPASLPPGPLRGGTILEFESEFPGTWRVNSPSAGLAYSTAPNSDQAQLVFYSESSSNEFQTIEVVNGFCPVPFPTQALIAPSRKVRASAFLAGPYDAVGDSMFTNLNPTTTSPSVDLLDQVYLQTATDTNNYDNQRMSEFATVPDDAVDIVRLTIRDVDDPSSVSRVAVGYGWLKSDGTIVDFYSGGELDFVNFIDEGSFSSFPEEGFLTVHHRTHLPVRNAAAVPETRLDYNEPLPIDAFDFTITNSSELGITSPGTPTSQLDWLFDLGAENGNFGTVLTAGTGAPYRALMTPGQSSTPSWEIPLVATNAIDYFVNAFGSNGGTFGFNQLLVTAGSGPNPINVYVCEQNSTGVISVDLNLDGVINSTDLGRSEFPVNNLLFSAPSFERP